MLQARGGVATSLMHGVPFFRVINKSGKRRRSFRNTRGEPYTGRGSATRGGGLMISNVIYAWGSCIISGARDAENTRTTTAKPAKNKEENSTNLGADVLFQLRDTALHVLVDIGQLVYGVLEDPLHLFTRNIAQNKTEHEC